MHTTKAVTSQNTLCPEQPIRNAKTAPGTVLEIKCSKFTCRTGDVKMYGSDDGSKGWMP